LIIELLLIYWNKERKMQCGDLIL